MVMQNGRDIGVHPIAEVSRDDILSPIMGGQLPKDWTPRNRSGG
jgi:D-xylose transport system ATP-binding protein